MRRNKSSSLMRISTIFLITFAIIFLCTFATLDLFQNKTSPRMSNSVVYGKGCPENLFHKRFKTLFRTWISVATLRNVTYFVCYGSLLGLYRDGDIVPYDNDFDVCIFRNELHKLESEDEPKPFKADDGKPHLIYQRHCHHPKVDTPRKTCEGVEVTKGVDQCTFLDPCVRIIIRSPTSSRTSWLDVFDFNLRDDLTYLEDDFEKVKVHRDIIVPLKPCVFMGMSTMCPNNITGYLESYYGKDFATNADYVCKNGEWVATRPNVKSIAVPRCPKLNLLCYVKVFAHGIQNMIN